MQNRDLECGAKSTFPTFDQARQANAAAAAHACQSDWTWTLRLDRDEETQPVTRRDEAEGDAAFRTVGLFHRR